MRAEKTRINRDLNRDLNEMLNQQFGVLGCTESPDGILMWNHYAQHHEGFVIGFDLTSRFFQERMRPVKYQENRPIQSLPKDMRNLMFIKAKKGNKRKNGDPLKCLANANPTKSQKTEPNC
jgi:hypothetical protein